MQRAVDKAKADRDRVAKKAARADKKAAKLREQVRQMRADAARNGVDLNALQTEEQVRAAAAAAVAKTKAEAARKAEANAGRPTSVLMAEHITANTHRSPHYIVTRSDVRPRSADKLAGDVILGLDTRYADPSRNNLPTGPFLRPTHEVVAGQRTGQPLQTQYRRTGPAQTRTVSPQATTRNPLYRPWGSAEGQLGGVKLTGGGR